MRQLITTTTAIIVGLFLFSGSIAAQSQLKGALDQSVNLAPQAKRGDVQTYVMDVEDIYLTETGTPFDGKPDRIGYTLLCLANSPDTGIVYQVTVDSLLVGQRRPLERLQRDFREAEQYTGMTFKLHIKREIPVKDGCYGFDIEFGDDQRYMQSYTMLELFTLMSLIEQMRYTAGRGLSEIGSSVRIRLPAPVCFSVPRVVNNYDLSLSTLNLTLEGFSLQRDEPTALVSIKPLFAKNRVSFWSSTLDSVVVEGMLARWGEFEVRLSDGDIVGATIYDRSDAAYTLSEGEELARSYRTVTITQVN